ncbi:hypothetical protein SAMN05444162_3923 [Paenibacillaceae bacterium GAS479]|nr:hypothetical protein SAMN05444162_3923 [Paenibacillaceae bacterium GAS479]
MEISLPLLLPYHMRYNKGKNRKEKLVMTRNETMRNETRCIMQILRQQIKPNICSAGVDL